MRSGWGRPWVKFHWVRCATTVEHRSNSGWRPERGLEAGRSPWDGGLHLKDVQSSSDLSDVCECLSVEMWIRQLPKVKGKCKEILDIFLQVHCPLCTFCPTQVQLQSHGLHDAHINFCTPLQHSPIFRIQIDCEQEILLYWLFGDCRFYTRRPWYSSSHVFTNFESRNILCFFSMSWGRSFWLRST